MGLNGFAIKSPQIPQKPSKLKADFFYTKTRPQLRFACAVKLHS